MAQQEIRIRAKFDANKDGMLDRAERKEARAYVTSLRGSRNPGGPGAFGGPGGRMAEPTPGPKVTKDSVRPATGKPLYDLDTLRTIFVDFENADWEQELADFHGTDVDVPATVTVDGVAYKNVGVRFRGMSSYMMVPAGYKRSLNLSVDMVDAKQRLLGYKTLNLLNCNGDPSFMSSVLFSHIANKYLPTPKANFAKVVMNGESWGIYANVEQFNNDFVKERFPNSADKDKVGARWKAVGSPQADGGLRYLGEETTPYRQRFEIKSKDGPEDWKALVELCRVLNNTPTERLEASLRPILDIEGALRFLALDIVLMNSDGYWTRASDYSLYRDTVGVFHIVPHDMNEAFRPEGGPGGRGPGGPDGPEQFGGPGGFGPPRGGFAAQGRPDSGGTGGAFNLDPLFGLSNERIPLRSKLLAVPGLRKRYLDIVREIAQNDLDWAKVGPVVEASRKLIDAEVKADTRKTSTYEGFVNATAPTAPTPTPGGFGPGRGAMSLRAFFEGRRAYLLGYKDRTGGES